MTWPSFFYPHKVQVRDLLSEGGRGDQHAAAPGRTLPAEVKDEQKIVRDLNGSEVVSSTQVSVPLNSDVRPGALVTVWMGTASERESRVVSVGRDDNTDVPLDSFLVLSLV